MLGVPTGWRTLDRDAVLGREARQVAGDQDRRRLEHVLGDQHAGDKGCWVDFFGRPASCHKAIALFPLTSGAPLAVSYARRAHKPLTFELGMAGLADPQSPTEEMASLTTLTQWYNAALESIIRESPSQYWWLHRRWRTPPERVTRRRQAA